MLWDDLASVDEDAIYQLRLKHVIVIHPDNIVKFDTSFLALVSDEIVKIFYTNLGNEDILSDLKKNRTKTARLAMYNVLSKIFKGALSREILDESTAFLDLLIVEAFPEMK